MPYVSCWVYKSDCFLRFFCLADKLRVYSNAEKTRTFLGMEISTGKTQLLELIKIVDETMKEFNLSTFYKDPSFHISLAWCVGDHTERLKKACLSQMQVGTQTQISKLNKNEY